MYDLTQEKTKASRNQKFAKSGNSQEQLGRLLLTHYWPGLRHRIHPQFQGMLVNLESGKTEWVCYDWFR